jgi:hypothetical protein
VCVPNHRVTFPICQRETEQPVCHRTDDWKIKTLFRPEVFNLG